MKKWKNRITAIIIILFIIIVLVFARFYFTGKFDSIETLQQFMKKFGIFAPLALTVFQAAQVVVPVLPSGLGYVAGVFLFGTWGGFLCNYIGITVGSIAAYFLGKKFGLELILLLFSEKQYLKWRNRIAGSKYYNTFLFIMTLLPLFPDDFLCYFSGMMKSDEKKFIWIMILGKPWCILAYSLGLGMIGG